MCRKKKHIEMYVNTNYMIIYVNTLIQQSVRAHTSCKTLATVSLRGSAEGREHLC